MSQRGFVEMARENVVEMMDFWHGIPAEARPMSDPIVATIYKLVDCQIMLLRAVEEVEARPWWKRRRYNPYAR